MRVPGLPEPIDKLEANTIENRRRRLAPGALDLTLGQSSGEEGLKRIVGSIGHAVTIPDLRKGLRVLVKRGGSSPSIVY